MHVCVPRERGKPHLRFELLHLRAIPSISNEFVHVSPPELFPRSTKEPAADKVLDIKHMAQGHEAPLDLLNVSKVWKRLLDDIQIVVPVPQCMLF